MHRGLIPILSALVWAAAVAQGSILAPAHLPLPANLPLLVALCGGWIAGAGAGAWLGFLAGGLMAGVVGMFFGSFTFSYLAAAWAVGYIRETIYNDWPLMVLPVVAAGTAAGSILFFLWNPRHALPPHDLVRAAAINALISPLVYVPARWIDRRLDAD